MIDLFFILISHLYKRKIQKICQFFVKHLLLSSHGIMVSLLMTSLRNRQILIRTQIPRPRPGIYPIQHYL